MKRRCLRAVIVFLTIAGCSTRNLTPGTPGVGGTIDGIWRLYETGDSPGYGYFIKAVPATPFQGLSFTKTGELGRQGEQLERVLPTTYYRIDTTQQGLQLILLRTRQATQVYSLGLQIRGDTMRLSPACYEGCHYGLVQVQ